LYLLVEYLIQDCYILYWITHKPRDYSLDSAVMQGSQNNINIKLKIIMGWVSLICILTVRCGRPPLLLPSCKKLEFKSVSVDGLGSGMVTW